MSASVDFVVATEDLADLKALIRREVPDSLIGTKDLGDGKTFVTVTGFARTPQSLAALNAISEEFRDKADLSGERPTEAALSDLVEKVRKARKES
ncbi:MAG: hypothetical protein FJZ01_17335 [Candidatus Sericytochromatia bacterium]|nr:hypothetical protein [Candidatus Tanganyikabacteria bacterium]